ncbi:MAG: hypothetical protein PHQ18_03580 [Patescibacteria group bacterium]|nr:hypothetical protein [Patescibacteria group bacterium]
MKYTRAVLFGVFLWAFIFVILSLLMFSPGLKEQQFFQHLILWVLMVPFALVMAKWYFHFDEPTTKKGIMLGVIALVVGGLLDAVITVPFFVKSYSVFYANVYMYIGMVELLLLSTYAGYEFDSTYTIDTDKK